jgi:hypothetical protein
VAQYQPRPNEHFKKKNPATYSSLARSPQCAAKVAQQSVSSSAQQMNRRSLFEVLKQAHAGYRKVSLL